MQKNAGVPGEMTQGVSLGRGEALATRVLGFAAEGEVEELGDGRWRATLADVPDAAVYGSTREIAATRVVAIALRALADKIDPPAPIPTAVPSPFVPDDGLPVDHPAARAGLDALLVEALGLTFVAGDMSARVRALVARIDSELAADTTHDHRGRAWGLGTGAGKWWLCVDGDSPGVTETWTADGFLERDVEDLSLLVSQHDALSENTVPRLHVLTTALRDDKIAQRTLHPNDDDGDECEGP